MKNTIHTTQAANTAHVSPETTNLLEGAPSGYATVKTAVTITERPHILTRRGARWARRSTH